MIFSSYYDIPALKPHLPRVGDTVTYNLPIQRHAATVTKRYRRKIFNSFSVFVKLSSSVRIYPIEVIQYWPTVGDTVEVSIAQYLEWQSQKRRESIHRIKAPNQLFQQFKLIEMRGQNSIIEHDDFRAEVPTSILRVVEVMGVRMRNVTTDIQRIANPEKVTADKSDVETFEQNQIDILDVLGIQP